MHSSILYFKKVENCVDIFQSNIPHTYLWQAWRTGTATDKATKKHSSTYNHTIASHIKLFLWLTRNWLCFFSSADYNVNYFCPCHVFKCIYNSHLLTQVVHITYLITFQNLIQHAKISGYWLTKLLDWPVAYLPSRDSSSIKVASRKKSIWFHSTQDVKKQVSKILRLLLFSLYNQKVI